MRLGDTEDWDLVNDGVMDHPFHVHINSFQVISRNGMPEPFRAWKDVVLLRPGETVRIRTRLDDFAGRSVYHCHILDHEELGMMGILEITACADAADLDRANRPHSTSSTPRTMFMPQWKG